MAYFRNDLVSRAGYSGLGGGPVQHAPKCPPGSALVVSRFGGSTCKATGVPVAVPSFSYTPPVRKIPPGAMGAYVDSVGNVRTRGAMTYYAAGKNPTGGSLGEWTDTVKDIFGGAVSLFGAQQRQAGQTELLQQQNKDLTAAQLANSGGISTPVIVAGVAVVGLAAFLLLRKKKGG